MANSWINAAAVLGFELSLACPEGFDPDRQYHGCAHWPRRARGAGRARSARGGQRAPIAVNTDVWASMGQEAEAERRKKAFAGVPGG
ncbi:MAG: hypothetical protein MZV70_73205 [Desulfobacterales bacterium]|nr:hypothetical protein [Desulfobacterales bacterium]